MRFRGRRSPASTFSRADRSRLIRLGLGLALVVAAIQVAADPATWVWLFPDAGDRAAGPTLADVSYDVTLDGDGELEQDEFRSEPDHETASGEASGGRQPPGPSTYIDADTLAAVKDDTLTIRPAERAAYYGILAKIDSLDDATIGAWPDAGATFPVVMTEPDHYRGRPIAIEGIARRILEIPAGANASGIETLYELWVFTPDSGNNPWRVVSTGLPRGLPRGELTDEGVAVGVTGVFFKRQGYETRRHALHVAPLLLAKTVRRLPPAGRVADYDLTPWLLGAVVVLGAGVGVLVWRFRREDRAFARTTLNRFTANNTESIASDAAVVESDPREFFRQLEAADGGTAEDVKG